jgi:hypothetical protein
MPLALRNLAAVIGVSAAAVAQNPLQTIRGVQPGESFGRQVRPYADVDGDGVLDFAVGHRRGMRIVAGANGATLREIQRAQGVLGDVNGDGWPDFWAPIWDQATGYWTDMDVVSGLDGAVLAQWPWLQEYSSSFGTVWFAPVALDDVTGDGVDDFLRLEARSAGMWTAHYVLAVVSGADASEVRSHAAGFFYVVLDDADGDGVRDYYLGEGSGGPLLISGASGATLATPPPTVTSAWGYCIGDIDGDGVSDLAIIDSTPPSSLRTQIVSTLTSTVLSTIRGYPFRSYDTRAAYGDFDGDGLLDLVMNAVDFEELHVRTIATGALVQRIEALVTSGARAPDSNADGREELYLGLSGAHSGTGRLVRIEGPYSELVGTPFAFGDGSSGPCPCAPGSATTGCANGFGYGARLAAWGSYSRLENDLVFNVSGESVDVGLLSYGFLLASANRAATPAPFGGGLLALAAPIRRIAKSRIGYFDAPSLDAWTTWAPSQTVHFQVWYREMWPNSACGLTSNLTNALSITFTP